MKKIVLLEAIVLTIFVFITLYFSGCTFPEWATSNEITNRPPSIIGIWYAESAGSNGGSPTPLQSGASLTFIIESNFLFYGGICEDNHVTTLMGYWSQTGNSSSLSFYLNDKNQTNNYSMSLSVSNGKLTGKLNDSQGSGVFVFSKFTPTVSVSDPVIGTWYLVSAGSLNGPQTNAQNYGTTQIISVQNGGTFFGTLSQPQHTVDFTGLWFNSSSGYSLTVYSTGNSNTMGLNGYFSNNNFILNTTNQSFIYVKSNYTAADSDPIIGSWKLVNYGSQTAQSAGISEIVNFKK